MTLALLIAATGWDAESWAERMRAHLPARRVLCADANGRFEGPDGELANVGYLLAWKPIQETIDRLASLRAIFSLGAGVDHLMSLQLPDVPVARIVDPDLIGRMSEYVTWQVLHHLRHGAFYAKRQRDHAWREPYQPAAHGVSVGIMGFGTMAADAADVLLKLGFRLRGWSRTAKHHPDVELFHGREGLGPFLQGTDILVSLLPLTPQTKGIIDGKVLRSLRPNGALGGPVFINAGRGSVHVEADVIEALHDGTLQGASLDVFEREPLPTDSPLWDMENVVITPHVAAESNAAALSLQIADQIKGLERGEPLRNLIDPQRGY